MNRFLLVLCCFSIVAISVASSNNANNPTISLINFKKLFDSQKQYLSSIELNNAFYALKGSQLLGETQTPQVLQEICNLAKNKVDKSSIESIFYATSLANIATNCQLPVADLQATLKSSAESTNVPTMYFYVNSALNLKQKLDTAKLNKNLLEGLKADSSIMNQAYALNIAYNFNDNQKTYYNNIDDLLDQADEVDKKFLQFEGGVATTSFALEGIFNLCEKLKQFPAKFDQTRITKFVNYLISKRYPTNVRSAYFLLRASLKFTDNQFSIPVVANRLSPISISASQSNLLIGLTNIIGTPVKQTKFMLEALSGKNLRKANGPELFSGKKTFESKSSDGTTFDLKLVEKTQPQADFYVIALNIVPKAADKRFYLLEKTVEVKVTTNVNVVNVQVGVADRDQSEPKYHKLNAANQKLSQKLDADQQSKFYLKFDLKDKAKGTPLEVHQSFVRITHIASKREIVFLAESAANHYSAEIDFAKNANNFKNTDGLYSVDLVIADSLIENPTSIGIVDLKLNFGDDKKKQQSNKVNLYGKKPEIKHLFRENEKMPPAIVSTVFAGLCLLPIFIMMLAWLKIGFNFNKFSFSLSGILFHGALALIFGLYYCYWVQLNMFQTIKYLAIIGFVALFFGQRLLSSLAAQK